MTEDQWRTRVDSRLTTIEERLQHVETSNAVDEVHRTNVNTRLTAIEDTLKWLVRLVLGAVILALLGVVIGGI